MAAGSDHRVDRRPAADADKAAELQRIDADLAQVERELRGEVGVPAGSCPACGTVHAADARFCSSCGQALAGPAGTAEAPPSEQVTQIVRSNGSTGTAP